jgi:hypothetical protein
MYNPSICLDALRKTRVTAVSLVGALSEIRAGHVPNTSLVHHYHTSLLSNMSEIN